MLRVAPRQIVRHRVAGFRAVQRDDGDAVADHAQQFIGAVSMVISVLMFPPVFLFLRHCEERSDDAIHACFVARWIASLRSQ